MTRNEINLLIDAMDNICVIATGEPSGISETWDGNIEKLEQHLERIEIYAEDEGLTETGKDLFVAAHRVLEAIKKEN